MADERNTVLMAAMRLLAAREHSRQELIRKLVLKGHPEHIVQDVVAQLVSQHLQSDARFIENFINSKRTRGQGPIRIQLELQQHQLPAGLVEEYLDSRDPLWQRSAEVVRRKKFGADLPSEYTERMRQAKFLEYRGFTHQQIFAILRDDELSCQ
jgi:regulatory protein